MNRDLIIERIEQLQARLAEMDRADEDQSGGIEDATVLSDDGSDET